MRVIEPFYYLDNFRSMLELIEVEAPGDRLQESQRRCFEFLVIPPSARLALPRSMERDGRVVTAR